MVGCIAEELRLRRHYLGEEKVTSIYFGGGTPSLLTEEELKRLLISVFDNYNLVDHPEITLEANPENITEERLNSFHTSGINRLSMGVQSFHQPYLDYLNRVHSSQHAHQCLDLIAQSDIDNFNVDLIYGIQPDDMETWMEDLNQLISYQPNHISAYNLTIEANTVFGNWLNKGKIQAVSQDHSAKQFEYTHELLTSQGYEHYEISNYCRPGDYAKHNTSYWKNQPYLGVGPGAHSYNKIHRRHNYRNNQKYIRAISSGATYYDQEILSQENMINEHILTGLRTKWGCSLKGLKDQFDYDLIAENHDAVEKFSNLGLVEINENSLVLTPKGQLLADAISSALMKAT